MRQLTCDGRGTIEWRHVPEPQLQGNGEALVRPLAVARCDDLFTGRAHAAALLPQVMPLIEAGRLRPEEVTTRVVDWEDAPAVWVEPAIKLVVRRV
jgi:hypothetical protein